MMAEDSSAGGAAVETPTAAPDSGAEGQADVDQPLGTPDLETADAEDKQHELPGVLSTKKAEDADAQLERELWPEDFRKDGEDGEEGEGAKAAKKGKGKERPRGPDGRFLKEGEAPPEDAAPPEQPPTEDGQQSEGFEFAGRRWDSQEKADQSIRSALGMIKPLTQQRDENYQAYMAWKDYAESETQALKARIAELEAGSGKPGSGSVESEGAQDVKDIIDWDAYRYIVEKGTPEQAGQYMIDQIMQHVNDKIIPSHIDRIKAEMDQRIAPVAQQHETTQLANQMTVTATNLAGYKLSDGRDAFPELKDPEALTKIGRTWAQETPAGTDPDARLRALSTPQGLMQAIALYRMAESMSAPAAAAPVVPAGTPKEPVAPGAAASVEAGAREGFTPGKPSGLSSEMAQIVAELDKGPMIDNDLGFARNPSARRS